MPLAKKSWVIAIDVYRWPRTEWQEGRTIVDQFVLYSPQNWLSLPFLLCLFFQLYLTCSLPWSRLPPPKFSHCLSSSSPFHHITGPCVPSPLSSLFLLYHSLLLFFLFFLCFLLLFRSSVTISIFLSIDYNVKNIRFLAIIILLGYLQSVNV